MSTETAPDRRVEFAAQRTAEAAERTRETAVRTSVAAQFGTMVGAGLGALVSLAAGVGAKATQGGVPAGAHPGGVGALGGERTLVLTGSVLVAFAAFCFVAAVWRELFPGAPPPEPDVHRLPPLVPFALNGFLALVALAVLLGVWFGRIGGT